MVLDGDKLRTKRLAKGMTQDKLAALSRVETRTIQRAESGKPVAPETVAFIAAALGTRPEDLRTAQLELPGVSKAWNEVVLIPISSGRRIIETLQENFEATISFEVEPRKENIEPLAALGGFLDRFLPTPWEIPPNRYTPTIAEILQQQANLNEVLESLEELGVRVFVGTYRSKRQVPRWDYDEGCMYVRGNQREEDVQIALLVVSDTTSSHLVSKPSDIATSFADLDEDIPF